MHNFKWSTTVIGVTGVVSSHSDREETIRPNANPRNRR